MKVFVMKYMRKAKLVAAIALATALPMGSALAQETASSINGTIVDSNGNVLSVVWFTMKKKVGLMMALLLAPNGKTFPKTGCALIAG